MSDLLYARSLMGLTLGFHIILAAVGVGMPLLMIIAEWRWLRTRNPIYLELTRRWAKGTAILFAVGAISGTVLSFELGLLWPRFMEFAGGIIGMPFSLEGFAFFTEAIFIGIYLYGWDRVSERMHLLSGIVVAVSGAASAFFVTLANAWMNVPSGFDWISNRAENVDPFRAMFPTGWAHEVVHVLISSYYATAFVVAAIHARGLLRSPKSEFHRAAFGIALAVGGICAIAQPISGDFSARQVARSQPEKLAALEGQFETRVGAPLRIGGIPDPTREVTPFAIEIPRGLSLLAFHDPNAEVKGLSAFPKDTWPNTRMVHLAFQVMVGSGMIILGLTLVAAALAFRFRRIPEHRAFLIAVMIAGPLGFVALEAGWLVTEFGRQPYVVRGIMRVSQAVTPASNLAIHFWVFTAAYIFLGIATAALLWRQIAKAPIPLEPKA